MSPPLFLRAARAMHDKATDDVEAAINDTDASDFASKKESEYRPRIEYAERVLSHHITSVAAPSASTDSSASTIRSRVRGRACCGGGGGGCCWSCGCRCRRVGDMIVLWERPADGRARLVAGQCHVLFLHACPVGAGGGGHISACRGGRRDMRRCDRPPPPSRSPRTPGGPMCPLFPSRPALVRAAARHAAAHPHARARGPSPGRTNPRMAAATARPRGRYGVERGRPTASDAAFSETREYVSLSLDPRRDRHGVERADDRRVSEATLRDP